MMKTILTILLLAWATPSAWGQGAFLGVELSPSVSSSGGAEIASVQTPSAASIMGLQAGDLVTGIDEQRVASSEELAEAISQRLPGELVTVHVMRGAETLALPGVLGRHPQAAAPARPWRSLRSEPLDLSDWMPSQSFTLPPMEWKMPELWGPGSLWRDDAPSWFGLHWKEQIQPWLENPFEQEAFRFPQLLEGEGMQQSVQIRYPESTPAEERERLIREAEEKYGPEVQVEFRGQGTSISIQSSTQQSWVPSPAETLDPLRNADDDEI